MKHKDDVTGTVRSARSRSLQPFRYIAQAAVAAYVLVIAVAASVGGTWAANLHSICPFGGIVNLYTYLTVGSYVAKLHSAVFIMLLALVIGLVLTGKSFCGWICPLGSVQQGLSWIGQRFWPRFFNKVPRSFERVLQYAKFLVLAWVLVQTARTAKLAFEAWDPYYSLFRIWSDEIAWSGYTVVGLTLVASLFIPRAFSRYACPLGAFNGLFNSFSFLGIKREATTCTDCGRCDKACPVNIKVSKSTTVRSLECTRCLKCVEACPVNYKTGSTLKLRTWVDRPASARGAGRRPVATKAFAIIAVAVFVLPILIANITGSFGATKSNVYLIPDDIKGSTSLQAIVDNYGVTRQELYNGLGCPEDLPLATLLKDAQTEMGLPSDEELVSPVNVREIIRYLAEPLDSLSAKTDLPQGRVSEVTAQAGLAGSATLKDLLGRGPSGAGIYLFTGIWPSDVSDLGATTTTTLGANPTITVGATPAGTVSTTGGGTATTGVTGETTTQAIKGTTTLGEIKAAVADFAAFLQKFTIPANESLDATLKDLAQKYGFEITAVRDYLAEVGG